MALFPTNRKRSVAGFKSYPFRSPQTENPDNSSTLLKDKDKKDSAKPRPGFTEADVVVEATQIIESEKIKQFKKLKIDNPIVKEILGYYRLTHQTAKAKRLRRRLKAGCLRAGPMRTAYGANVRVQGRKWLLIDTNDNPNPAAVLVHENNEGTHQESLQAEQTFIKDSLQRKLEELLNLGEGQFRYERQLLINNLDLVEKIIKGEPVPFPLFVEIHPSGKCNNNCRWCRGESGKKTPHFAPSLLDEKVLLRLIDELHGLGVKGLLFDGYYGEPLLNPATVSAMRKAIDLEMQVGLGTNGRLLDSSVREVAVYANYVRVSLDVGSNEMYNLLKGTKGKPFNRIIGNLTELAKLKRERKTKVRIGVSFIIQPENVSEIISITEKVKSIGADDIQFKLAMADLLGRLTREQVDTAYQHLETAKTRYSTEKFSVIIMQTKKEAIKEMTTSISPDYDVCYPHHLMSVIGPEGNVYPCCEHTDRPGESFGNVNKSSFAEIWSGKRKQEVMGSINPSIDCPICSRYNARINRLLNFLAFEYLKDPNFFNRLRSVLPSLLEERDGYDLWQQKADTPAILGGKPVFKNKINIIEPTSPTDKCGVLKTISTVVGRKMYSLGFGYRTRFEEEISRYLRLRDRKAIAVNSGTDALVLLLIGTEVGLDGRDEVIVPSFTFHTTIRAILRCGLKPVFVDVDPKTLTIDPEEVEKLISDKTGAIMPIDAFGNPADYERLQVIASKYRLKLLVDSAPSFGSTYRGKPIGNFGDGAALSFSFGKIVQAFGRGGAVIVDDRMLDILKRDPRGTLAASRMQEVNAVMGYDNMQSIERHLSKRQSVAKMYEERLKDIPGLSFQRLTKGATSCYTHFPIIVNEGFGLSRDQLKWALAAEGIQAKEYFPPQHRDFRGYREGDLSHTERISGSILCLPVWSDMDTETATKVAWAVRKIYNHRESIARLFERRNKTLKSFVELAEGPFTIERNLLFRRFYLLEAMLTGEIIPPPEIEVHPSNVCNNKCRFCIGTIGSTRCKKPMLMTPQEIHKILQDIVAYNTSVPEAERRIRLIRFSGHDGEPLCSPATLYGMQEALKLGLETSIVTNGILLDAKARDVIVNARYAYISLYGGSSKSYSAVTGANLEAFDRIIENTRELAKLTRKRGTNLEIGVGFLIQPENYREALDITKKVKQLGVGYIRFRASMEDEEGTLTSEQWSECYKYMREAKDRFSDDNFKVIIMYSEEEAKSLVKKLCVQCFAYPLIAIVGPNSKVYPCTHRSYASAASFGNLKESTFKEIWTGKRKRSFIRCLVPSRSCPICPPQAGRVNEFLRFLAKEAATDPTFLDWVEEWAQREVYVPFVEKEFDPLLSYYGEPKLVDLSTLDPNDEVSVQALREDIERSYREIIPRLKYSPSIIQVKSIKLSSGIPVNIGYVRGGRPRHTKGADLVTHILKYKGIDYKFGFRGRPYTEFHIVFATGEILQNSPPQPEMFEIGLLMARILGKNSELFYNRVAPTTPNFHYQIIKSGRMTIWDNVFRWPAFALEKRSKGLVSSGCQINDEVAEFVGEGVECDVLLKFDGEDYRAILIPRRDNMTRASGCFQEETDFGTFGGLEMGGYFVSCKTERSIELLTGPEAGNLYENALRELSYTLPKH